MDIRKIFLDYFKEKGHLVMPSSGLIPKNDPTILLTTAGMQQFKPYYLGIEAPPAARIATVQKCFRTSDIDNVGYTGHHLTFFEMLGNFSFGDYFKRETIKFSIDFIKNVLNIPLEKLSTAVFKGEGQIPADEESINYWLDNGISPDRIYRFGKSENFWGPAGDTGPCGPCTEIFYDFGPDKGCGRKNCSPGCDCGRFLEIWNLVFTQYNFDGKNYAVLPKKNIDTGMGLERIMAVLEGKSSVFGTELFRPILDKIYEITGKKLKGSGFGNGNKEVSRPIRIIADHLRAIYFLIADGVTPSNEGRGYILRRIIRRAVRFGRKIGIEDCFLNKIGNAVIESYSDYYPELAGKYPLACSIVLEEEERFTRTLMEGSSILDGMIEDIIDKKKKSLDPQKAFRLYETYGFPVELTAEILRENNILLDLKKVEDHFRKHAERSRKTAAFDKKIDKNLELYRHAGKKGKTDFIGYESESAKTTIECIIRLDADGTGKEVEMLSAGEKGEVILKSTVFYGEKGGQVGDEGIIKSEGGIFIVNNTHIPLEGVYVHRGYAGEGVVNSGEEVDIEISRKKRMDIKRNHTSTHLLHWALRTLFGEQVKQSGSFVSDKHFRFDYSIYNTPDDSDLLKIERMINEKIQMNDPVRCFETTMEYAVELGAIALFDEKYGKFVRVVEIDDYSRELCGGTHVRGTGEIGIFKIISDSSIGANLRRIEAVTGMHAYDAIKEKEKILTDISKEMEVGENNLLKSLIQLKDEDKKRKEDLEELRIKTAVNEIIGRIKEKQVTEDQNIIAFSLTGSDLSSDVPVNDMSRIADRIKDYFKNKKTFIAIGSISKGKPVIVLACTNDMVRSGVNCGKLAGEMGSIVKGGGGGRPEFARLGGSDKGSLPKAMDFAVKRVKDIFNKRK
jgi:alanyl-tRNA synthetase